MDDVRDWEIWNQKEADFLSRAWGKAGKRGGRHWLLMKKISKLITNNIVFC